MKKLAVISVLMVIFSLSFAAIGLARYSLNRHTFVSAPLEKTMIDHEGIADQGKTPVPTVSYTSEHPAPSNPILTWSDVEQAVVFEIELSTEDKDGKFEFFFTSRRVYTNGFQVTLPADFSGNVFYWRVRGIDIDGNPNSDWSTRDAVYIDSSLPKIDKPVITSIFNTGRGTVLLYPVYAWIPLHGAAKYEIEILNSPPENPNGIEPSEHRVDSIMTSSAEQYDPHPRYATTPFYWRVRGVDDEGNPVGVYSDAGTFSNNPDDNYTVATYGDSITHGGGSISYSPSDWDFSYQHYLNFDSINLAQSGDTSEMTVERFERDVLPFHPRYLLILMGSNSLRAGVSADDVIKDMQTLKKKCLDNGILPVFLTLPPINPDNIQRAFDEPTAAGWQTRFNEVNAYVRSQVHIDDIIGMADANGQLPTRLGLDGLHLDPPGKRMMAAAVNAAWPDILTLPEEAWNK